MYSFVAGCAGVILRAGNPVKIKIRGNSIEREIYANMMLRAFYLKSVRNSGVVYSDGELFSASGAKRF
jgi:hypothetical protein